MTDLLLMGILGVLIINLIVTIFTGSNLVDGFDRMIDGFTAIAKLLNKKGQ